MSQTNSFVASLLPYRKYVVKVGIGFDAIGLLVLAVNFIKMYDLVGICFASSVRCGVAYTHWRIVNAIGLVLVLIGVTLLISHLVIQKRAVHKR